MSLNIPNLDQLLSYLEALPPEEFNMQYVHKRDHPCGIACCISGHIMICAGDENAGVGTFLGAMEHHEAIMMPDGWDAAEKVVADRYPLSRALRMLRHLRAEFLRTGNVVVDWDAPEAVETPRKPWAPPLVIGADKPLPAELTRLVREPASSV